MNTTTAPKQPVVGLDRTRCALALDTNAIDSHYSQMGPTEAAADFTAARKMFAGLVGDASTNTALQMAFTAILSDLDRAGSLAVVTNPAYVAHVAQLAAVCG